jgi:hypothetical protein
MTEEFNLSDKEWEHQEMDGVFCYSKEDVKEFIKRLKDRMGNTTVGLNNKYLPIFYKEIDELAGDKLIS